jgi:hypothetical protein
MISSPLDVVLLVLIVAVVSGYPALLWWMGHGFIWPIDGPIRDAPRRAMQRLQETLMGLHPLRVSWWRRLARVFMP